MQRKIKENDQGEYHEELDEAQISNSKKQCLNSICSELNNKSNNICDHAINGKNEIIQYGSNDTNQNTKQENTNVNIQELSQKENENKLNSSPSLSKYYENKENFKTSQTDDKNILPSLLELAKQDHADEPIVRNLNYKYNNEEGNNISHISSLETVASLNPIQKFDCDHYKKNFPEEDKFINEEKYFVHKLNDPKYIQSQPNVNNTETYQTELCDNQTKFSQNCEKNVESFSKNSKDFGKIDYYDSCEHQRYHYSKNYRETRKCKYYRNDYSHNREYNNSYQECRNSRSKGDKRKTRHFSKNYW